MSICEDCINKDEERAFRSGRVVVESFCMYKKPYFMAIREQRQCNEYEKLDEEDFLSIG